MFRASVLPALNILLKEQEQLVILIVKILDKNMEQLLVSIEPLFLPWLLKV